MSYRIVQWGTGNVGRHALRTIVERPDFELVGVRVYDPAKVGRDAGELLGVDPVGVRATDDVDALLALDADCVSYNPLGTTLPDFEQPLADICRILESGANVVSSAVDYYIYPHAEVGPRVAGAAARDRIAEACARGGSSFYAAGINPGFMMDAWPITMSRLCRRVDRIELTELVDMRDYDSPQIVRHFIGLGMPPDYDSPLDAMHRDEVNSAFYVSLRMLADALGVTLDEARYSRESAVADASFTTATGEVAVGDVAAMRLHFDGVVDGRVVIALSWVWRLTDDVAPEWPTGDGRWLLRIEGDPNVESEVSLTTGLDAKRPTSLTVATVTLNAVPAVCAAPPGILTNLTIPPHGGGYPGAAG